MEREDGEAERRGRTERENGEGERRAKTQSPLQRSGLTNIILMSLKVRLKGEDAQHGQRRMIEQNVRIVHVFHCPRDHYHLPRKTSPHTITAWVAKKASSLITHRRRASRQD